MKENFKKKFLGIGNNIKECLKNNSDNKIIKYLNNLKNNSNDIIDKTKPKIYLFKASWCGHCQHLKSTWKKLKKKYNKDCEFIELDFDKDNEKIKNWNPEIEGFPTIYGVSVDNNKIEHQGSNDLKNLSKFVEKILDNNSEKINNENNINDKEQEETKKDKNINKIVDDVINIVNNKIKNHEKNHDLKNIKENVTNIIKKMSKENN